MIIDVLFIKVDAFDSPGLINDLTISNAIPFQISGIPCSNQNAKPLHLTSIVLSNARI